MQSDDPGAGYRRILVYGVTGSGKTTLAQRISDLTGIPWHSVDDLTWEANWQVVPLELQRAKIQAICDQPEWILDTAYNKWSDIPLARAQVIVALDYPRALSFFRLLRRTLNRVVDKRTVCNGNVESLRLMLSRESILIWHFKSFSRKRARIRAWAASPNGPSVIVLNHPRKTEQWCQTLSQTDIITTEADTNLPDA